MSTLSVLLGTTFPMAGCKREEGGLMTSFTVPHYGKLELHHKLELLRNAFESKQEHVTQGLSPPIPEEEFARQCSWFPGPIHDELAWLYAWHDGQSGDAWQQPFPFWFRDCAFASLATAELAYNRIMDSYGKDPGDHKLLKHCFPFAEFNGGWLVLPCKGHPLDTRLERPVISVMQGIDVWFYSLGLMVDTCIEWVSHPDYDGNSSLPDGAELAIWRKHNPGIFEGDT